jgi:hypothetical protein
MGWLRVAAAVGILSLSLLCRGVWGRPYLQKQGTAVQLVVEGKPFLMRGVETTNKLLEDPSDLPYLDENLAMYREAGVNTVLIPIAWYSFEPQEDEYDYTMIDALIQGCRRHDLKLIPLWFGSIKNGAIGYAPKWVRDDRDRLFRAVKPDGSDAFAISPFCRAAIAADREAFALLMRRIRQQDPDGTIVIMVQPENETGCQAMDKTRDHSAPATRAWNAPVPGGLLEYLVERDGRLVDWLQNVWERRGKQTEGTWPEVFGDDLDGQKIFMAYYIARLVEKVASAGRAEYDLPIFANDWLGSLRSPGGPIGGPDFQVMDLWRFAAPTIDIFAPDIYKSDFKDWCAAYHQRGNPLLIPEAKGRQGRSAAQAWYAFCQHDAMLYAPYLNVGDEYHPDHANSAPYFRRNHLDASYPILADVSEAILERQGRTPREMIAFLLDADESPETVFAQELGGCVFTARANVPFPDDERETEMVTPFAAVLQMGDREFVAIGTKMAVEVRGPGVKVAEVRLGRFREGRWTDSGSVSLHDASESFRFALTKEDRTVEQFRFKLSADDGPMTITLPLDLGGEND